MEAPANFITPSQFCVEAERETAGLTSTKMDTMRAEMGEATTVTAMKAVASLGLPFNLTILVLLTENMPGGKTTKPGDVVTAMNRTTIQVYNTDAEGRLMMVTSTLVW